MSIQRECSCLLLANRLGWGRWRCLFLLACLLLVSACINPAVPRDVSIESNLPAVASHPENRHVLAGEWEYSVDGTVVRLALDEQGNGHYDWKGGRFETHALIGQTWHGMWFQKENDRDGIFTVVFSPDFSEGDGRWWYSRIETDHAPTQNGGTFHLRKMSALLESQR